MTKPDDITCYECGSGEPAWSDSVESVGCDYDGLVSFADKKLLQIERVGNRLYVNGMDKVGVLLLPSGRRIVIRSKVPNIAILEWLAFLGIFPDLESWHAEPAITRGCDFHDCIGRLFIRELDELTRHFLRKDFMPVRCSTPTLRGRVLTTLLCRAMHRLPNVPQLARTRTFDSLCNVVLALALDKVPLLMSDQALPYCQDMARLRDAWAHISRETTDTVSSITHVQWGCPPGYRNALQLARLILIGAIVDSRSGVGGLAFTLSLAAIWQDGLRKIFEDLQMTTGWKLLPSTRPWADATNDMDKNRWMTADFLVERDGTHWVLDAKYKRGFGNENRADRFQIAAYALGFAAQRATLIYPTGSGTSADPRLLLNVNVGNHNVRIDSIELPMAMGPEACRRAIESFVEWVPIAN